MPSLDQLEGRTLAGSYPLTRLLRAEADRAWYATICQSRPATAYLVSSPKHEDLLSANLEAACRVKHPNLMLIERVGRARLEGVPVLFAILEPTEQNLADVLRERALDTEETTQITESLVAALGTLHEHGLLHGSLGAASVFAAGETIKLRSDCAYRIPPGTRDDPQAYAQDLGDLGALIFQALTQRTLTSPADPAIARLPAPFRAIVASAITGRWGITDISAALKKSSIEPRHPVPAPAHPPGARFGDSLRPPGAPAVLDGRPLAQSAKRSGTRLLAALVFVAVLALAWYAFRSGEDGPGSAAGNLGPAMPAAPLPRPPASHEKASSEGPVEKHSVWRVVVYTYASEVEAQQKAELIDKDHPELKPEVFTAAGQGPYLVTVGGAMGRDEAFHLRDQVGDAGLPPDAYTQNYSH